MNLLTFVSLYRASINAHWALKGGLKANSKVCLNASLYSKMFLKASSSKHACALDTTFIMRSVYNYIIP